MQEVASEVVLSIFFSHGQVNLLLTEEGYFVLNDLAILVPQNRTEKQFTLGVGMPAPPTCCNGLASSVQPLSSNEQKWNGGKK